MLENSFPPDLHEDMHDSDLVVHISHKHSLNPDHTFRQYHNYMVHNSQLKRATKVMPDGDMHEVVMFSPHVNVLNTQPKAAFLVMLETLFFQHVVDIRHDTTDEDIMEEVRAKLFYTFYKKNTMSIFATPNPFSTPS